MILKSFSYSEDQKYVYVSDDPHYSLDFIIEKIQSKNWDKDIIEEEVEFVKSFFIKQCQLK